MLLVISSSLRRREGEEVERKEIDPWDCGSGGSGGSDGGAAREERRGDQARENGSLIAGRMTRRSGLEQSGERNEAAWDTV